MRLFYCRSLKNLQGQIEQVSLVTLGPACGPTTPPLELRNIAKQRLELLELQQHSEFVPANNQAFIVMSTQGTSSTAPPLALPASSDAEEAEKITVNGTQTFKFDKLGPVVVNKDGVCLLWLVFCACQRLKGVM